MSKPNRSFLTARPFSLTGAAGLLAMVISCGAQAQNLVPNPGFELPGVPANPGYQYLNGASSNFLTGWTVTFDGAHEPSYVYRDTLYPTFVYQGSYSLELSDGDSLSASVPTTPGKRYVWSFAALWEDGGGQRLRAGDFDSVVHPARDGAPTGLFVEGSEWKRFALTFTASADTTTISIDDAPQGLLYTGLQLDDMRVVECSDLVTSPLHQPVCPSAASVQVDAVAFGEAPSSYQWQYMGGATTQWTDLQDGVISAGDDFAMSVSGSHAASLVISNLARTPGLVVQVRCIASGACGVVAGDAASVSLCLADLDCSGTVDLSDFFAFFSCFDVTLPCADLDASGEVDLGDFFTFFSAWDLACGN